MHKMKRREYKQQNPSTDDDDGDKSNDGVVGDDTQADSECIGFGPFSNHA